MSDLLPTTILMQILCYPWLELKYELNTLFIENRHTVRSTIRIFSIVLATCVGLYIVLNNPTVLTFFTKIIKALEFVPVILQTKAAVALSVLASSSFGAYASKAVVRSFCKFRFGDPDFFLTKQRRAELIQIFKSQEIDIEEALIQHVVDFCVANLREPQASSEFGATPKDWERILNSLIYDADLDLFLDQQAALQAKHKLLLNKQAALHDYKKATASFSYTQPTEYVQNTELLSFSSANANRQPVPHTEINPVLETSLQALQLEDERTPLLCPKQTRTNSETRAFSEANRRSSNYLSTTNPAKDNILAQKVLAQFKHVHHKKTNPQTHLSEEQLLHQCSRHLEHKALCTSKCILDNHTIGNITRRISDSSTPSSNFSQGLTNQEPPPKACLAKIPTP
ncbi:MAG: hypothetical protein ABSA84_00730 [Gammaproteobacteria bacterium]